MSAWANQVELRHENGEVRAYNHSGMKILIPNWPKEGADIQQWMDFASLDALEAFRQVYWDKWTWESGNEEHARMAALVESEIEKRAAMVGAKWSSGRTVFDRTAETAIEA